MKKMLSAALALAVALGLLAGCSGAPASSAASVSGAPAVSSSAAAGSAAPESTGTPAAERTAFRIASLKGPTTMGLVKLMDEADKGEARHDYEVTMYGAADEIAPQLIKGDIDVALVPCNLAGVLYNKTGGAVEVAAVNTLGVLYVVTTGDDITSVADLAGKTIYTTGKGTTPEYVLNYVLTQNGLTPGEDVTIEYMSEATEVLAAMQASSGYPVAMLPQPYVTTAQMQMEGLKVALDMTEEWDKVSPDSALVTGVVVARKEFVEQNEAAFNEFLEDYKASTEFVNANVDGAARCPTTHSIMARNKRKNRIANTLAVCFWLCAWQAASVCIGQKLILVSPLEVCGALLALLPTADFWQTAAFSAGRIIGGFLLALALGLALAALAAALRWVEVLLRPLMLTIKSIPVASFIILALMWLRSAGNLAVFISFLMVLPVVYTNTLAGIRETDARLLEMAAVFRVPPAKRVRYLYVPAALPYFRSACTVGLGLCWKSGVAAEVIGITSGSIGEALYNAKILFSTAELLAWTVVIVLLSLAFERLFLWGLARVESVLLERSGT